MILRRLMIRVVVLYVNEHDKWAIFKWIFTWYRIFPVTLCRVNLSGKICCSWHRLVFHSFAIQHLLKWIDFQWLVSSKLLQIFTWFYYCSCWSLSFPPATSGWFTSSKAILVAYIDQLFCMASKSRTEISAYSIILTTNNHMCLKLFLCAENLRVNYNSSKKPYKLL